MSGGERQFRVTAAGESLQACRVEPPKPPVADTATLVLLHEALGSITQWRDFPAALAAATGLPVLAYDRCGFGRSQPLAASRGDRLFEVEVASLHDLLEVCEVTQPVLFGHSDGATIALLYAATYPDRPRAVISVAAHLFVEPETLAGIRAALGSWRSTDLRARLARHHGDKVDSVFAEWAEAWLDPAFRDWDIKAQMRAVRCPVLAVQGADDQYGTPAQLDAIAAGIGGPCRTRLLEGCAHAPHHEARAALLEETVAFLSGRDRATRHTIIRDAS